MAFPPPQHFRGASYNREPPFEDGLTLIPGSHLGPLVIDWFCSVLMIITSEGIAIHRTQQVVFDWCHVRHVDVNSELFLIEVDVWGPGMERSTYPEEGVNNNNWGLINDDHTYDTTVAPPNRDPKFTVRKDGEEHAMSGCLPGPSQPTHEDGIVPATSFPRTIPVTSGAQKRTKKESAGISPAPKTSYGFADCDPEALQRGWKQSPGKVNISHGEPRMVGPTRVNEGSFGPCKR